MRRLLTLLMLVLSGLAAHAMPGATVGIPLGSPDPFGTMRRGGEPPVAEAGPDGPQRRVEPRPKTQRPLRQREPRAHR